MLIKLWQPEWPRFKIGKLSSYVDSGLISTIHLVKGYLPEMEHEDYSKEPMHLHSACDIWFGVLASCSI